MGCFKDTQDRANQQGIQRFDREGILKKCLELATQNGHDYFGVLDGVICFTDNEPKELAPKITSDYTLYNTANGCQDGRGAVKQINIYSVEGHGGKYISC